MSKREDDFYIGYVNAIPKSLHAPLVAMAGAILIGFSCISLLLSLTQDSAGNGGFQWDAGYQNVRGVLEWKPYPVIHAEPSAAYPNGHTYLLAGEGKVGAQVAAIALSGHAVEAGGFVIKRGTLDMLQVGGDVGLRPVTAAQSSTAAPPKTVDLGHWRVNGEICDGKCYAGAMRPGTGLAHKACANLCLIGQLPPVLVTAEAVAGSNFFLLGTQDGDRLPDSILDYVAIPITAEGRIEHRGDMPVFLLDLSTLRTQ